MYKPSTGSSRTSTHRKPRPRNGTIESPHGPRRSNASSRRRNAPGKDRASALDRALDESARLPRSEIGSFDELGLPDRLVQALNQRGLHAPFAIQSRALPDALAGRDVLGRAQTGSGKTLAFGLPVLARLADTGAERHPRCPRALVLTPTRELARQVADTLQPLGRALKLTTTTVVGGAPYPRQIEALARGVDVLVATPGRLVDLIDRGSCDLSRVRITVLDEADHMADLGFLPAVTTLLGQTPSDGQRLLFSATLDRGVAGLVTSYLTDPAVHAAAPATAASAEMTHQIFTVDREDKPAIAAEVASRPARTLFFVRTKHGADRLAKQLGRSGVEAVAIHGNLRQGARQRALSAFSEGSTRVLVATDVAARGIHVDGVDLVVHYDPPNDHKDYLHRSGRTARAGNSGTVVALVQRNELPAVRRLHADARVEATSHEVGPGHPAVRAVATSGDPVVVTRPPRAAESRSGPRRRSGAPHRPDRKPRSRARGRGPRRTDTD
jgi:superfamily II DNA/RNA helicase